MPYPDKLLSPEEEVVRRAHPHWIALVAPAFVFVVLCAAAGLGWAYVPGSGDARTVALVAGGAVLLFALVRWCLAPWIRWRCTHYVITTHRILIRRGVFSHSGRDIALARISDVAFSKTLWDRLVGAGTLVIESAGEHGSETLDDIGDSEAIQQLINTLIEEDGQRRARTSDGWR